jgi:hypothetical protein
MCDLNSVLLAGTVSGEPRVYEDEKRCSLLVSSWGYTGNQAEPIETRVWVVLRGSSHIDGALKTAKDGCQVCIVGKLDGDGDGVDGIYVEAEDIEYLGEQ